MIATSVRMGGLLLCLIPSFDAFAFGATGHMTVGTIADRLLDGTNAAKQARKILGSNLRTASVWPDCAKGISEKTFRYEGEGKFPECAVYENKASEDQMAAFVKRNLNNCERKKDEESCHRQYHYTDVAVQRNEYSKQHKGTNDHDIVSAIAAAISVLQGNDSPAPFQITSKREALRLLVHYVGDIHQPLHVVAVYLDRNGKVVDPDAGHFDPATGTKGGNEILHGNQRLHSEWDNVPASLNADNLLPGALPEARAVAKTVGPISEWSTTWATESLIEGKAAFKDLVYSKENSAHNYKVTLPAGYNSLRADLQREQIIKAGARLAQILTTIWP